MRHCCYNNYNNNNRAEVVLVLSEVVRQQGIAVLYTPCIQHLCINRHRPARARGFRMNLVKVTVVGANESCNGS